MGWAAPLAPGPKLRPPPHTTTRPARDETRPIRARRAIGGGGRGVRRGARPCGTCHPTPTPMRPLPFLLLAVLLLPATADAQRRRVVITHDRDEPRGTDIQALGDGLSLDAVGLRFWLSPRTALTTRITFAYDEADVDGPGTGGDFETDALELGVALGFERHLASRGRVSPFVSLAGAIGIRNAELDAPVIIEDGPGDGGDRVTGDVRTTVFGGEAGLGAEFRIAQGLSLSGTYLLAARYESGEADDDFNGDSDIDAFSVRLGGLPRLALSFRF